MKEINKKNSIVLVVVSFIVSFVIYIGGNILTKSIYRAVYLKANNLSDLRDEEFNIILSKSPLYLLVSSIASIVVIFMLLFIAKKLKRPVYEYRDAEEFKTRSFKLYLIGIGLAIINMIVFGAFAVISGLYTYEPGTQSQFELLTLIEFVIAGIIYSCITGYCEELLHRGIVFKELKISCPKFAVIITSFLFMLTELGGSQFKLIDYVGVFFAGVFFCYLCSTASSMFLSAGFHSGVHFILLMVMSLQKLESYEGPFFAIFNPKGDLMLGNISLGSPYGICTAVINILGILVIYLYNCKKKNVIKGTKIAEI